MKKQIIISLCLAMMAFFATPALAQNQTVKGTVVDDKGEPIIGASVMVAGEKGKGTVTDLDGNYTLQMPANGKVIVSYIGYISQTVKPGGTVTRQVIGLLDGNSLLSETPFGQGHLYLLATPLRPDYTDFVHQALFVPTLYNMALFSTPLPQPYHLITATQPIPLSTLFTDDSPRHLDPVDAASGQQGFIPDIRRSGSHSLIYPHGEIVQAGNYILSPQPLEGLAFNYSRQESDLACLSRSDIKRLVNEAGLSSYRLSPPAAKSMTDYIRSRNQGTPLWRWCILLALLALLAETLFIRLPLRKSKA